MAKSRLHLLHLHLLLLQLLLLLLPLFTEVADACVGVEDPDPGTQVPDPVPISDQIYIPDHQDWRDHWPCPHIKPTMGSDCTDFNLIKEYEGQTCSYGEEHCCGKTYASFNASCDPNVGWTGFNTDACLEENCDGRARKRWKHGKTLQWHKRGRRLWRWGGGGGPISGKPTDPKPGGGGGCYNRFSLLSLANGEVIRMDDLRIGQFVQVADPAGIEGTSKFIGWTEKHHSLTEFYRLTTESENVLTMTGTHGLFIWKAGSVMATFAKDLTVGDLLVVSKNSNRIQAERLKSISIVHEFGALAPLTESGTIMVNNVSTSCYASYPHQLAHFALLPARWWPKIFLDDEQSQTKEGIRSYITNIKWLGRLLSTSGFRIDEQNADSSFSKKAMAPIATASVIGLSVVVFYKKTTI